MPLLIGMDEAGYGPNLGPLVITAVVWEVPGQATRVDLWKEFADVVGQDAASDGRHLQIADSKSVYTPARGLEALERGVLSAIALWRGRHGNDDESVPRTFHGFRECLTARTASDFGDEPWYRESDLDVPHVARAKDGPAAADGSNGDASSNCGGQAKDHVPAWRERCTERRIGLRAIRSAFVSPEEFNQRTRQHDSKGRALSEISMQILGQVWQECAAEGDEPALIIADKHGGRNRYHEFLPIVFGDKFIRCRGESLESSRYQVGKAEIRFETKSERHLPVALASMVSKYLRELAMVLFNRYWTSRLPDLKPTAGYPNDAVRFRREIAPLQKKLAIADDVLWRER